MVSEDEEEEEDNAHISRDTDDEAVPLDKDGSDISGIDEPVDHQEEYARNLDETKRRPV